MNRFVIAIYVENKYGALTRIAGLFMRKGVNIDTAIACETTDPNMSTIIITVFGDEFVSGHLVNLLKKLHNVKKVVVFSEKDKDSTVEYELLLLKILNNDNNRKALDELSELYNIDLLKQTDTEIFLRVTDEPGRIKELLNVVKTLGLIDMCATGPIALSLNENITG